jgi:hypothetical protein
MGRRLSFGFGLVLAFVLGGLQASVAFGEDLSADDANSLASTQDVLKDPTAREAFFKKTPEARATDQQINGLTGSADLSQEVYTLAADIFPAIVKATGGDLTKMQQLMSQVHRNPASLKEHFTPEQLTRLKALADKIEKSKVPPAK